MSDQGRHAVARVLCEILAERHPGTTWLPVEPTELGTQPGTGEIVRRLTTPQDPDPAGIKPSVPTPNGHRDAA